MKKFLVVLGVSALATLTTQGAYANDSAKISAVKNLAEYELRNRAGYDSAGFRKFLSFDFNDLITDVREFEKFSVPDGEMGCVDSHGLVFDTQDASVGYYSNIYKSINYQVLSDGRVRAEWSAGRGREIAVFKVVSEGGKWVVDDVISGGESWKRSVKACMSAYDSSDL